MKKMILTTFAALTAFTSSVAADIKVRGFTAGGTPILAMSQDNLTSLSAITIPLQSNTGRVYIFDGNSTIPDESINSVTITGASSATSLFVVVGDPAVTVPPSAPVIFLDTRPGHEADTYALNLGSITVSDSTQRAKTVFAAQVSGNVTGTINMGKIRRLVTSGASSSISGTLTGINNLADGTPNPTNFDYAIGLIDSKTLSSSGSVNATSTTSAAGIGKVRMSTINGAIAANSGGIIEVNATGDISMPTKSITARDGIDSITARSISVLSIDANTGGTTTSGLSKLKTTGGAVAGDLAGNITANQLRNGAADSGINVAGTLSGHVTIGTPTNFGDVLVPITCQSMNATKTIRVYGTVRANIAATTAGTGQLGAVNASGSLGTISNPITISAPGGIGNIDASFAYATVTSTNGGAGNIAVTGAWTGSMDVASVGTFNVGPWIGGTLKIRNLIPASGVLTVGNIGSTASVLLPGGLSGRLSITDSLLGALTTPYGALKGQVIVNAGNDTGVWTSNLLLTNGPGGGTVTITPSNNEYPQLSGVLGADADGGAVGRAPFTLHDEDCKPANSGTFAAPPALSTLPELLPWQYIGRSWRTDYAAVYPDATEGGRIRTRFYGPIKKGASAPVVVQRFNGANPTWVNESAYFETDAVTTGDSLVRDVFTRLDLADNQYCPGTLYRIIRNDLKCAHVTGSPDVAEFAHYFRFGGQINPADVAGQGGTAPPDGALDNNDFVLFINYFFASDPHADLGVQGGTSGQDGLYDNNDFVAQTNIFFSGPNQVCSIDDQPLVPFELPEPFVTNELAMDRQLNALWIAMERAGDARLAPRFINTFFNGAD